MNPSAHFLWPALAACLLLPALATAEIYKWVDESGAVHFGDAPPRQDDYSEVTIKKSLSDREQAEGRARLDKLLSDQEKRERVQHDREVRESKRLAERQRQEAERAQHCLDARTDLQTLLEARPVYWLNEKGEREYVSDATRPAAIRELRERIRIYCN